MQCRYKEKVVKCGDMIFGVIYPEYRKAGRRRGPFRETSEVQARNNERRSVEYHKWVVHENFTNRDYFVSPTFDEENLPADRDGMDREIRNYIARLKRHYARTGAEFRYYIERVFGEGVRPHFHLYLSGGVDRLAVEELWGRGFCNVKQLEFNECGITDLAVYSGTQSGRGEGKPRRRKGEHRFSGSRNLKKPVERVNTVRYSKADVEAIADAANPHKLFADRYKGYWLSEFPDIHLNAVNHGWWISFAMYRPDSSYLMPYIRARNRKKYRKEEGGAFAKA